MLATEPVLVAVYDRGGNFVGKYHPKDATQWTDQPWSTTVRDKRGNIRRVYWKEPPPEIEGQFFPQPTRLTDLAGQRYVFLQKIWPDTPYRVFTLTETRFMPQEMMTAVARSVTRAEGA